MPRSISKHAFSDLLRNAVEPVTDRELRPRFSALIEKQLILSLSGEKQTGDDVQRDALQVDDALGASALAFFCREHNALVLQFHMARLYMAYFLRAAAGIPDEQEQVAEGIGFRKKRKNLLEVLRLHVYFAALRRGLLQLLHRVGFKIPQLDAPIVEPLNGNIGATLVCVAPAFAAIHPIDYMERLKACGRHISDARMLAEGFEMPGVPFKGAGAAMALAPNQVLRAKVINRNDVFHDYGVANYYSSRVGELVHIVN